MPAWLTYAPFQGVAAGLLHEVSAVRTGRVQRRALICSRLLHERGQRTRLLRRSRHGMNERREGLARICKVEGCEDVRMGWGYCSKHFQRFR